MSDLVISGRLVSCSDEDLPLLSENGWVAAISGGRPSVRRAIYENGIYKRTELFHRLVTGCPDDMVVDHINGDQLDNRRENLRICTHQQNMWNRKIHSNNKLGLRGVYFDKSRKYKPWRAQINFNGKKICIGRFYCAESAFAARLLAEDHFYGEFAPSFERSVA